jgi:hypothetical protein
VVVVARLGTLAAAAYLVARGPLPGRPATLCPLRALTGVPCPLCGGTTALVELGHGELTAALATAPVPLLAAATLVLAPLGPSRWWASAAPRTHRRLVLGVLVVAEIWQLARLGVLAR